MEYKYNFQIKKEQIKEMIGFSMTGLVIIPDNIFTQAEKESDYKKMFMIINLPKKNLTVSTRYIEEKLQQGKLDEAFCKLTIQGIDKKENVLNQMVAILVAIIILIFTMFITWLMLQNDQEHLKRKYQIGAILGVKREGRVFIRCERNIQRHVVVPFTCDRYKWNVLRRIYKILLLRNNGNCFDTKGSCNVRMDFMHIWNYFYDIYYFFNQAFMERNFKNMG